MRIPLWARLPALAIVVLVVLSACRSSGHDAEPARRQLADQARRGQSDGMVTRAPEPAVIEPATAETSSPAAATEPSEPTSNAPAGSPASETAMAGPAYTIEALVGQVNGRPVYAGRILDPIDEQLKALSRTQPPQQFVRKARELIATRVDQVIFDQLILGEAERMLSDRQRDGLRYSLKEKRSELVRKHGRGSEQIADKVLLDTTGKDLVQTLREERERLLVQNYTAQQIVPKIDVTRSDIERYYQQNIEQYQPAPQRTIHMIVADAEHAPAVAERLVAGESFLTLAADAEVNTYRPAQAGLFAEKATGEKIIENADLNAATLALEAGRHTQGTPLEDHTVWVYVEKIEQSPARTLQEVQAEIELHLRSQQLQVLTMQYRRRLLKDGSFTPQDQMINAVMEVALSRYMPGPSRP
ncbi:MAG: peptidyl-prolyl cis-trans isomerase [Phycisphaeraceae bacterium]|nr:peptidyl-prolyl cis-trans isomerase [Phycisphaeraceae bacterium]